MSCHILSSLLYFVWSCVLLFVTLGSVLVFPPLVGWICSAPDLHYSSSIRLPVYLSIPAAPPVFCVNNLQHLSSWIFFVCFWILPSPCLFASLFHILHLLLSLPYFAEFFHFQWCFFLYLGHLNCKNGSSWGKRKTQSRISGYYLRVCGNNTMYIKQHNYQNSQDITNKVVGKYGIILCHIIIVLWK